MFQFQCLGNSHITFYDGRTEFVQLVQSIVEIANSPVACVTAPRLDDPTDEFDTMSGWLNVELIRMDLLVQCQ